VKTSTSQTSGESEGALARAIRKVLEDRIANSLPGDDAELLAELQAALPKLTARPRSRRAADDARRIHIEAIEVAERKRTADEEWITRLGGGDLERGLEVVERHHREAESAAVRRRPTCSGSGR
jgi:hypothetical protein